MVQYHKVVVHELLHVLGVSHEQQRPDRDSYLVMHWDNIRGEFASNLWRDVWAGQHTIGEVRNTFLWSYKPKSTELKYVSWKYAVLYLRRRCAGAGG